MNRKFLLIPLGLLGFWIVGFSIFSYLPREHWIQAFYPFAKLSYGTVCHQIDEKSFVRGGVHFLVCSRCAGIYVGAFIALLFLLLTLKWNFFSNWYFFAAGFVLLLTDVVINNFLFAEYFKMSAFLSGYLFSFLAVNFTIFELKRNIFIDESKRNTDFYET